MDPNLSEAMTDSQGPPLASDVRLCGYLRKQKSQRRRYFVLRCASARGPARLEYYESEKKFHAGGPGARPKRSFPLANALSISKRADARHRHLLVLCGRDGTFGAAAESAEQQQTWHAALVELHRKGKASPEGEGDSSAPCGPPFKEVWQVSLRPRGLGHAKHLAGPYLLCLTDKSLSFVKLNTDVATVVLQLLSVRRCGHSENYFFVEVGRSAATGPGELWMQVEDGVVAQNMHETILEAMKALSEDGHLRGKSHALPSAPISVPPRHQPLSTPPPGQAALPWRPRPEGTPASSRSPLPPGQQGAGRQKAGSLSDHSALSSDEGGSSPSDTPDRQLGYISMGKLALPEGRRLEPHKRASLPPTAPPHRKLAAKPVAASASYPEGLNRSADPGYMAMLPGGARSVESQAYIPMGTPGGSPSPLQECGGYMLMSPSGSSSPDGPGRGTSSAGDYVNMSPLSCSASSTPPEHSPLLAPPGAAPFYSLPRSYKHGARPFSFPASPPPGRLSGSSSTSSDSLEEFAGALSAARPPLRLLVGGGGPPAAPRGSGEYVSIACGPQAPGWAPWELLAGPAEASKVAVPAGDGAAVPLTHLVRADARGRRRHGSEAFPEAERNGVQPSEAQTEPGLNYIDLDLAKEAGVEVLSLRAAAAAPGQGGGLHTYASIDFHCPWELRGCQPSPEQAEL